YDPDDFPVLADLMLAAEQGTLPPAPPAPPAVGHGGRWGRGDAPRTPGVN
ncbi:MAG: hypothetical protein HOY76_43230, partial [Streptomyces sp.]|nr:hypothetical protein [Streptomyces sp.]